MKSKRIIKTELNKQIKELNKIIECNHNFYPYGLGYKCRVCDYYTGLNSHLNAVVKKEYNAYCNAINNMAKAI
jgi:hypothetical protein